VIRQGRPRSGRRAAGSGHGRGARDPQLETLNGRCLARFAGERWEALEARDARPQRPLWASTGTKDPTYPDVLYVEKLIARAGGPGAHP
jgi:hypothetical protein